MNEANRVFSNKSYEIVLRKGAYSTKQHSSEAPENNIHSCLTLKDVNYYVHYRQKSWLRAGCFQPVRNKHVLHNLTLAFTTGRLVAVVGSSGSGKTSLLDVIAFRTEGKVNGTLMYKGMQCTPNLMRQKCSYVIQADRLLPTLTVKETLTYAAYLTLPDTLQDTEFHKQIDTVITQMGLRGVANSRVGDAVIRGISGGEKRRLTIAIKLLQDPDILLLDEPTTNLDSFTARHLVANLQQLARQGRMIILSIHQPRYDIVELLDQTLLLSQGYVVFFGPTSQIVPYFNQRGFPCPRNENPLDTYIDLLSTDYRKEDLKISSTNRIFEFAGLYEASDLFALTKSKVADQRTKPVLDSRFSSSSVGWFRVFFTVIRRMNLNVYRSKDKIVMRLFLLTCSTPFIIAPLGRLKYTQSSIADRLGLLFQIVLAAFTVASINVMAQFPQLRNHFYREGLDGLYSSSTFLLAYIVHIIQFSIISAVLFSTAVYWITEINSDTDSFGMFVAVMVCLHICGELLAVVIMAVFLNPQLVTSVAMIINMAFLLFSSGLFRTKENMLSFLEYLSWASIFKYSTEILVVNVFHNLNLTCEEHYNDLPCLPNGDVFLEFMFPGAKDNIERNFEVIIGYSIGLVLLSIISFRIFGLRLIK